HQENRRPEIQERIINLPAAEPMAPRVAASSYLNTAPLIWSFTHGSRRGEVELIDAVPARCASLLARAEAEAAVVPVIEYQRIPGLTLVPDVCVGSRGRVRSVVLVSKFGHSKDV